MRAYYTIIIHSDRKEAKTKHSTSNQPKCRLILFFAGICWDSSQSSLNIYSCHRVETDLPKCAIKIAWNNFSCKTFLCVLHTVFVYQLSLSHMVLVYLLSQSHPHGPNNTLCSDLQWPFFLLQCFKSIFTNQCNNICYALLCYLKPL